MFRPSVIKHLSTLLLCLYIGGCSGFSHIRPVSELPLLSEQSGDYIINPGDTLDIKFFFSPDLNETVTVRPDGKIALQLVDDVMAAGLTPEELDDELTQRYRKKLPDQPDISVIMRGFGDQRVYVTGEVGNAGEFELKNKMTIFQAVTAAGGFLDTARRGSILVIRQDHPEMSNVYRANLSNDGIENIAVASAHAYLMPRDIVYVPKSDIAEVNLFMDQFIRDTLLFNGFNLGVSGVYELNDKDGN